MTNNTIHNVPRELLERAWRALANSATGREIGAYLDADPCAPECAETCARASMCSTCSATLSAQPPAGADGLEVVAWVTTGFYGKSRTRRAFTVSADDAARQHTNWTPHYRKVTTDPLCHLSGAQAIIDGLLGEVERLQMQLAACGVVALANTIESAGEARQMHPDYMSASCSDVADAVDREIALRTERDTLRQQLAVRDEEIERIRVQLMTIASAEPARHSIEWAKAVAATGNNEVHAKWREAFDERDQHAKRIGELEWLLREVAASLAWNAHGECRAIHDGPIMPSQMAIDAVKAALGGSL